MGKLLVWLVVGGVAWLAWRLWTISRRRVAQARSASQASARGEEADPQPLGTRRADAPESMMQCAVCGVYLPGSEARFAGGRTYCSEAHRDAAAAGVPPSDGR